MHRVKEVAKRLNVSVALVYALCDDGRLVHHRLGVGRGTIRVDEADLQAFLEESRVHSGKVMVPVGLKHLQLPTPGGR